MNTCKQPPEGWYCTRGAGHDGPCAAIQVTRRDLVKALAEAGIFSGGNKPPSDVEAEAIKIRWTIITMIKSINVLLAKPFLNPGRYENLTLALRHLEDAESRLNRIIDL